MKLRLLGLALAVLPALAESRAARVPPILLYADFGNAPSPVVLSSIEHELETIMARIGLSFGWRMLKDGARETASEVAVVTFKGRCDAANPVRAAVAAGPLGWTHVSDGVILPFSDVDCDSIHSFVQGGLLKADIGDRARLYGRALARVLAHELYHVFAHTQHHGQGGLAKPVYSVNDLLRDDFRFEQLDSDALRVVAAKLKLEPTRAE